MNVHIEKDAPIHNTLFVKKLENLEKQNVNLEKRNGELEDEIARLKAALAEKDSLVYFMRILK